MVLYAVDHIPRRSAGSLIHKQANYHDWSGHTDHLGARSFSDESPSQRCVRSVHSSMFILTSQAWSKSLAPLSEYGSCPARLAVHLQATNAADESGSAARLPSTPFRARLIILTQSHTPMRCIIPDTANARSEAASPLLSTNATHGNSQHNLSLASCLCSRDRCLLARGSLLFHTGISRFTGSLSRASSDEPSRN